MKITEDKSNLPLLERLPWFIGVLLMLPILLFMIASPVWLFLLFMKIFYPESL